MDNDVNLHFTLLYLERDGLSIIKSLSTLLRSVIIYKWQQKLFDSSLREVTSYPVVVLPLHAATQQVEAPVPAFLVRSYCFPIKKNIDINCHFHTHEEMKAAVSIVTERFSFCGVRIFNDGTTAGCYNGWYCS